MLPTAVLLPRCRGYELTRNLDFDLDGDGSTWSGNAEDGFTLDMGDSQADYFPVANNGTGGWLPIGDGTSPFVAVFDGNGHRISNLAIRRDQTYVGLFGVTRRDGGSGAALRNLGLVDNLADYTGSSDHLISIGGLVGLQSTGSSITTSYATGNADGGSGDYDVVGGLVGYQEGGSITASYATGDADGGDGDSDSVGGLVGRQRGGLTTASYATGDAYGGSGGSDSVGGLVGQQDSGSITASYATGNAYGGSGGSDSVGGLVGFQYQGSITASYGFGGTIGGESVGSDGSTKPQGVSTAAQLTAANTGATWDGADTNTLGAWDFGTDEQIPALNYADYDGTGTVFDCSQFPANTCGTLTPTLLPGQADLSASGPSAAKHGETVSLAGSLLFGRVTIVSWSWRQLEGLEVTLSDAAARETTFTAPTANTLLVFELTATDSKGHQYTERISLAVFDNVVDRDGDGLIEIDSLLMLHNMRNNLAGTSYKTSTASVGNSSGCPDALCRGYELTRNLDFDRDGDGSTWSGNGDLGYSLDSGDSQAGYFPVDGDDAGGWLPIGDETNPFVAVFDGNGHRISNLAIRRDQTYVGLFGVTRRDGGSGAAIRNLGLVDNLADYTGSSDHLISIGGLVGLQGTSSSITASYATGDADGGDGDDDYVGGLVGYQTQGSITASYATGDADGGDGDDDYVGGLVGYQTQGSITASYATGDADGGDGDDDYVGGLVGYQTQGSITASYATGDADGGDGNHDSVGGLVGFQDGLSSSMASYGFGGTIGGESVGSDGSTKPQGVGTAAQLTAANAGSDWNDADTNTLGAWDFGTDEQIPALNYADYDGPGTVFDCSQFPANACGTPTPTLLPGQADLSASGPSATKHGKTVSLAGSLLFGRVTIESWSWRQLEGLEVTLSDADARKTTFTAPTANTLLVFKLTATDSEGRHYTERIRLVVFDKVVDRDGDGLIEIDSLLMLHNMRHNLAGTSYKTSTASVGNNSGCPDALCLGYELTRNLDFDRDGDGSTWSDNGDVGYTLHLADSQADYFPVANDGTGGWLPIGDATSPFVAVFDGNGHRISNLAIRRDQTYVGLFGATEGGAAIRNLGLVDNLADYTGSSDNLISIGGLVGRLQGTGSSIMASYATGDADGGDGSNDRVGGLVGWQQLGGSITASYASGDADGGNGDNDRVGGLVGWQRRGSITASYATGDADGGDGVSDRVGGLVGYQGGLSLITASYATGDADGGDGVSDRVGGLVGFQGGLSSIRASYGFGGTIGGAPVDSDGSTKPQGVSTAAQLTEAKAGSAWNSAANNTLGAWDFGTNEQIPALNYADYDGVGTVFDCSQFAAGACETQLPRQADVNATGLSAVAFGANTTITGSLVFGRAAIVSWSWEQLQGPNVTLIDANTRMATFRAPANGDILLFELTATDSGGDQYTDRILLSLGASVDHDGDGLIEIDSLTMLHNMRHNLAGTSYKESADADAPGAAYGCPAARCRGYELTRNLDFDVNGDGSTWSGNAEYGFTLDSGDSEPNYFPVDAGGWLPIGNEANPFVAVFDGNGNTISNLAIRRDQTYIGLFGAIGNDAVIRNLGLVDNLADYTGSSNSDIYIGGLVGRQDSGSSITASYAMGDADGGDGNYDNVGGLVGWQSGGSITASYTTGDADGGDGNRDRVGGLVGYQTQGSITASYAMGDADGGDGDSDHVGGLVGLQSGGSITASYTTGDADGGDGDSDHVGGLVGLAVRGFDHGELHHGRRRWRGWQL